MVWFDAGYSTSNSARKTFIEFTSSNVVFLADIEAVEYRFVGHGGVQERMVDHLGKVIEGDIESRGGCHFTYEAYCLRMESLLTLYTDVQM